MHELRPNIVGHSSLTTQNSNARLHQFGLKFKRGLITLYALHRHFLNLKSGLN